MPLVNSRLPCTLEELNDIDYELQCVPWEEKKCDWCTVKGTFWKNLRKIGISPGKWNPKGFTEINRSVGASLFHLAMGIKRTISEIDSSSYRETHGQSDEVWHTGKNVHQVMKKLQFLKNVGQFPLMNTNTCIH